MPTICQLVTLQRCVRNYIQTIALCAHSYMTQSIWSDPFHNATANLPSDNCCSLAASSLAKAFFSFFRCFFRWLFVRPSALATAVSCELVVSTAGGIVAGDEEAIGVSAGDIVEGSVADGMANGLEYFCAIAALPAPRAEALPVNSCVSFTVTALDVKPDPSSFCFPLALFLLGLPNASNPVFAFFAMDLVRDSSSDSASSDSAASCVTGSFDLLDEPLCSFRFKRPAWGIFEVDAPPFSMLEALYQPGRSVWDYGKRSQQPTHRCLSFSFAFLIFTKTSASC